MRHHLSILLLGVVTLLASCVEADVIMPHGSTNVPGKVTVTEVVNRSGMSVIYYKLPDDTNLQYVKAIYSPRPGVTSEVNASFFTDSLVLNGFKEAGSYPVELYSISYGGARSDAVWTVVDPETPPYQTAVAGLDLQPTFGGVYVGMDNPTQSNLVVTVSKLDEAGQWVDVQTNYTSQAKVSFSVRGQEAVPATFKVTVKDRWGSTCESGEYLLTPLYEALCDKSLFKELRLAGDTNEQHSVPGGIYSIWDNKWNNTNEDQDAFHTKPNSPIPQHVSFDMGAIYDLSRFVFHPRHLFYNGHPHTFEIYGAVELNPDQDVELFDVDGNLDPYWYLLGSFESTRPSGYTVSSSQVANTTEDLEVWATGQEFEFDFGTREARYIRFRTTTTWGNVTYVEIPEIDFYGALHGEETDD